jgi:glutamine amidotransferase
LPHIGWNDIIIKKESSLFNNLKEFRDFYYVHSYHLKVDNQEHVLACTDYEESFNSIVSKDNIYGFQFHPEKSQKAGQLLLNNFIQIK